MMHRMHHRLVPLLTAALALVFATNTFAQSAVPYPVKPVRMVVPNGAGGPTDVVARLLAQGLTEAWGQQVVVENRPGAAGNLGTEAVAKAPADGHTLLMSASGPIVMAKPLFEKLAIDPTKDLAPISLLAWIPLIIYVAPQLPVNNLADFLRYAKERPGKLNYASTGPGSTTNVMTELFKRQSGADLVQVPCKAVPQALAAVMTGETAMFLDTTSTLSHVKTGKLRALAIASRARFSGAPDLPTATEAGLAGFTAEPWVGLLAPAGTPRELRQKIQTDSAKYLLTPAMKTQLAAIGFDAVGGGIDAFAEVIATEAVRWNTVVKAAGIKLE